MTSAEAKSSLSSLGELTNAALFLPDSIFRPNPLKIGPPDYCHLDSSDSLF